ncbi:class I adenylate-forming enzyme family protein [Actinomycetospora chibensis]|uniref:Class I adenylate-forming enzyme family protein n=1 Tax=Actinomycetospora chibensis TaxID=663606 RepID=A0ABV9RD72_9PSEU|nr:AMP-binding protein [Actinomycetospora chibensis]MDD7925052.1 AMP-binding protein [Actinomycetospora chibensis]
MTLDRPPVAASTTERTLERSRWDRDEAVPLAEATIGGLLADRAEHQPDAPALIGRRHGDSAEQRYTYGELFTEARVVAAALLRVAEPGDHVALLAPNVVEWPVIEYGAALAGVVLVALNPALGPHELTHALTLSRASVLLHADTSRDIDLAGRVAQIRSDLPDLRETISLADTDRLRADPTGPLDRATPTTPAMMQFTSGTTGKPKGVLLAHRSLVNNARFTVITAEVPAGTAAIAPLPMFHTAACVISTLGPTWLGGAQVLIEKFDPGDVLRTMVAEDASVLFSVPTVLGAVLEAARRTEGPVPQLEAVLVGASTVPGSMIEAVEQTFGASVHNLFGQTELSPVLSLTRRSDSREDLVTKVGRPLPHTDAQIVDATTGEVLPIGVQGEICARGYGQMIEYYDDPDATATTVDPEGWLHTGDLGTMDARGLITVTGRLKEIIIRGGENIAPAEIEVALAGHPEVLQSAVVGLPDDHWGEIVGAAVVVREPGADGVEGRLEEFCRERLAKYKVPARWFVVDELPTTASGKVQKFALRDQLLSGEPS